LLLFRSFINWRLQHFLRSAKEIKPDRESEEQSSGDFVGLHNVAKHCIYLKEAFAAIDYTQEELRLQHQEYFKPPSQELPSHHYRATWNMLKHKRGLFKSTSLRVESLNKRVENIINLVSSINVNGNKSNDGRRLRMTVGIQSCHG
jgi:hypothetical protein